MKEQNFEIYCVHNARSAGFIPDRHFLKHAAMESLKSNMLSKLLYKNEYGFSCLTMIFGDGENQMLSPTEGFYMDKPNESTPIATNCRIKRVTFNIHTYLDGPADLCGINIQSKSTKPLADIQDPFLKPNRQEVIELFNTQAIVSARIDTHGNYPCWISLVICRLSNMF